MSGAFEAREALRLLDSPKIHLRDLVKGIFHAGREGRTWVVDRRFGVPFIGSSDIRTSDLSHLPLISKKQVKRNPLFALEEHWTLITRSGTIGRMAYVRPDMSGLACSEHVLRVVPDESLIPPGYLYAYLSSKFGLPLVISGTYGAIIQHIEPEHISDVPVPRFDDAFENKVSDLIVRSAIARAQASQLLRDGVQRFLLHADLEDLTDACTSKAFSTTVVMRSAVERLDASYYSPFGSEPVKALGHPRLCSRAIGDCAKVFTPGIFKRMHVDDPEWGYPYFSGSELFELSPAPRGFLSRRAPGIGDYLVEKDWLLVQDAGQVGGLIGRVTRAGLGVDKSVVSNHLMRIASDTREDSAYLFAILTSAHGYRAIVRNAFGSSIPQLDPKQIARIKVPWLGAEQRADVSSPILRAWELSDRANIDEKEATSMLEARIEAGGR